MKIPAVSQEFIDNINQYRYTDGHKAHLLKMAQNEAIERADPNCIESVDMLKMKMNGLKRDIELDNCYQVTSRSKEVIIACTDVIIEYLKAKGNECDAGQFKAIKTIAQQCSYW